MTIKEFAIDLRNRLLNGVSPEIIAREIKCKDFTNEQKRQVILYLQDTERSTEGNNEAFLKLVSEVKKGVIGDK